MIAGRTRFQQLFNHRDSLQARIKNLHLALFLPSWLLEWARLEEQNSVNVEYIERITTREISSEILMTRFLFAAPYHLSLNERDPRAFMSCSLTMERELEPLLELIMGQMGTCSGSTKTCKKKEVEEEMYANHPTHAEVTKYRQRNCENPSYGNHTFGGSTKFGSVIGASLHRFLSMDDEPVTQSFSREGINEMVQVIHIHEVLEYGNGKFRGSSFLSSWT
ncbi:hypothetical protein EDD18DRAFT_1098850 [Armillaria luteobubalina]|uniref:Uncharacterized protein n=1 Tax=Armillaria luteobubalina TaxID=153913 RepID=A0AA39V4P5_9AGAR|nr:hypothetical protein EDD18DRAFT_1098850 [Armillaria luteobubalina]